jgi:hypothetical protein
LSRKRGRPAAAKSREELIVELADLREVMDALLDAYDVT